MRSASLRCSQRKHCGKVPGAADGAEAPRPDADTAHDPDDTALRASPADDTPRRSLGVVSRRRQISSNSSNFGSRLPVSYSVHAGCVFCKKAAHWETVFPSSLRRSRNLSANTITENYKKLSSPLTRGISNVILSSLPQERQLTVYQKRRKD